MINSRIISSFAACVLCSACATKQPQSYARAARLPDSIWSGTLDVSTTTAEGKALKGPSDLVLDSCDGNVRMWEKDESGKVHPLPIALHVESLEATHLYSLSGSEEPQPGWEEIHTLTAVEVSEEKMWFLWTRVVNNRDLQEDHPKRYFHNIGSGILKRLSTRCMRFKPSEQERE